MAVAILIIVSAAFIVLGALSACKVGKWADKCMAQEPAECITPATPKPFKKVACPDCGRERAIRKDGDFHKRRHRCTVGQPEEAA